MKKEDDSEDSIGKRSPIIVGTPSEKPPVRARPSFITNREYISSLMVFATFVFLAYGAQLLAVKTPTFGFIAAVVVFAFMAEWERRARYSLGRVRQRAHFDQLSLVRLPTHHVPANIEIEPPTPWISQNETVRTDPATILKRAQDTISGGGNAESGAQSAMELAPVNLLKMAAAQKLIGRPFESQKPAPESKRSVPTSMFNKGSDAPPRSPTGGTGTEPPVVNDQEPPPPPPSPVPPS